MIRAEAGQRQRRRHCGKLVLRHFVSPNPENKEIFLSYTFVYVGFKVDPTLVRCFSVIVGRSCLQACGDSKKKKERKKQTHVYKSSTYVQPITTIYICIALGKDAAVRGVLSC